MTDRHFTLQQRQAFLQRHGSHCLAISTLQPGLDYVDIPDVGYVAYKSMGTVFPTRIVLGDPVCDESDLSLVLDETLLRLRSPVFVQTSSCVARELARRGYYTNHFGVETNLKLNSWDLKGERKQTLRTALNRAKRAGVEIREIDPSTASWETINEISTEWLATKATAGMEMQFLTAPLCTMTQPAIRLFIAAQEGALIGFGAFSPLYQRNAIIGYYADIVRTRNDAPSNLAYAIKTHAAVSFQAEQRQILKLGVCPGYRIHDRGNENSVCTTILIVALFQLSGKLYGFKGLATSKSRFAGEESHTFFCSRSAIPFLQLYRLFLACGIRPVTQCVRAASRRITSSLGL